MFQSGQILESSSKRFTQGGSVAWAERNRVEHLMREGRLLGLEVFCHGLGERGLPKKGGKTFLGIDELCHRKRESFQRK